LAKYPHLNYKKVYHATMQVKLGTI